MADTHDRRACPETGRPCITLVPLQEHLESRLDAVEKATVLAARAMEARLDQMNEFRAQLRDQTNTFVTRVELGSFRDRLDADIRVLREYRAELQGKASGTAVLIAQVIAVLGLLMGLVGLLLDLMR